MSVKRIFPGRIDKKFIPADPIGFSAHLRTLDGHEVEVTVRRLRKTRSNEQNRYLHGVVIPLLAEHLGYEMDEMKDALKFKFLRTHDNGPLPGVRRTRDLDTAEMTEFIEQTRRLAAELGCVIPSPNEVDY